MVVWVRPDLELSRKPPGLLAAIWPPAPHRGCRPHEHQALRLPQVGVGLLWVSVLTPALSAQRSYASAGQTPTR